MAISPCDAKKVFDENNNPHVLQAEAYVDELLCHWNQVELPELEISLEYLKETRSGMLRYTLLDTIGRRYAEAGWKLSEQVDRGSGYTTALLFEAL